MTSIFLIQIYRRSPIMQACWLSCTHYITISLGWIPVIFDIFSKMEKRMPRQRATSPTIYSELVKWNLTIWCFHESVLIFIITGADTTTNYNPHSLMKIFLCKLCTLSKCDTWNKIRFLFTASVYLATAMLLSFTAYLISGFLVSLPIKITLFIIVTVLSAATLLLHILHHQFHCPA